MNKTIFLVAGLLIASIGLNLFLIKSRTEYKAPQIEVKSTKSPQYPLLSSQIETENENDLLISFIKLRKQLRDYAQPFGDNLAFYFEYLPTGESIGVNDRAEFDPASLLKVPLAIAYFNNLEDSGVSLNQTAVIKEEDIDKRFGNLWQRGVGAQINLDEALKIMLVDSDNTAALLLTRFVPEKAYEDVYNGLDIDYVGDKKFKITAKGYSSILKSLYYASIINPSHSEMILDDLTESKFDDLLLAGVPKNIKVAHKIGVLNDSLNHDCGIVYVPKRPYALCVFSKSSSAEASVRIKTVSQMVYDYISSANK